MTQQRRLVWIVALISLMVALWFSVTYRPTSLLGQDESQRCPARETDQQGLASIRERGCLIVGVLAKYSPFSAFDGSLWQGFEADLARQITQLQLGADAFVEFQMVPDRLVGMNRLERGTIDLLLTSLQSITETETIIDLSTPYLVDQLVILSLADKPISRLSDLAGKRVAIVNNSLLEADLKRYFAAQDLAVALFNLERTVDVVVNTLREGDYDAIAGSAQLLSSYSELREEFSAFTLPEYELPYQIGVRNDDAELVRWLNCALAGLSSEAEWQSLFETLPVPVTVPVIRAERCQTPVTPTVTPTLLATSTGTPTLTTTPTVTSTATLPTPNTPIPSTLDLIRDRGFLIAGVKGDTRLFGFRNEDGEWEGFEIDLMRELADRWLGNPELVEFVQVISADRIARLTDGDVDLLAATMTHTKARDKTIDFSQTYFLDGQNIIVRGDAEEWPLSDLERIKLLDGKRVAAVKNSTSIKRIAEFARENGIKIEIAEFEKYDQAVEPLRQGVVDALTTDRGILAGLAGTYPELMILLGQNFSSEPYGMGVRSGDSLFADLLNYTLQEIKADGTYDELHRYWFCPEGSNEATCPAPYPIEQLPGVPPFTFANPPTQTVTNLCLPTIEKLIADGRFIAGVKADVPSFGYRDPETGRFFGFEVDLMREFALRWLGNADAVDFSAVTSRNRLEHLKNCSVDILAATMTHTNARDVEIDFSQTYYRDGQNFLVRRKDGLRNGTDLQRIGKLDGKRIGAVSGSTSYSQTQDFADLHHLTITIEKFEQYDQAIQPLLEGSIDALSTDRGILIGLAQQYPELVVLLEQDFSNEPYGLGIRNGDHRFRDLVNFTLQEMMQDGTYEQLYRYWFGISSIMQEEELTKSEQVDLIQRYWTENAKDPVEQWLPYPIEVWPGLNYFTNLPTTVITTSAAVTLYNDLAPMVFVPEGESYLGTIHSLATEVNQHPGRGKPQLIVTLDSFYIDQREVTNHQYRHCVDLGLCSEPPELSIFGVDYFYAEQYLNHPVVNVTWEQAQNYCAVFGKTLPTEAQWEKAARYGASSDNNYLYPWGDSDAEIELRATYASSLYHQDYANPVGIYRFEIPMSIHGFSEPTISLSGASPLGVLDLAGSVQEWTADCYDQQFYADLALGSAADRHNPANTGCGLSADRAVRSSGYYDQKYTLPTIYRQGKAPTSSDRLRGFRCVAPADQGPVTRLYVNLPK